MRRRLHRPPRFALVVALALSAAGGARAADPDPAVARRILAGQLRLTRGLLDALAKGHPGENVLVSPASAAGMLAAVDLGAGPAMHDDILNVLGIAPGPAADADMAALREAAARTAAGEDLSTATRVVFDRALDLAPEGLDRLGASGIEGVAADLHAPTTAADINAWVARATRGKIAGIVDRIDPSEEMIALDALYFSGRWTYPFEPSDTRPADFTTESGQRVRAPFMHGEPRRLDVRQDERFIAVDLPFQGRFAMVALTTRDGPGNIADFEDHLVWLDGQGSTAMDGVAVHLPRFEVKARQSLLPTLEEIGLDAEKPFSRFAKKGLVLSDVRQAVDLVLDEKGTEVAAVTVGGFRVTGRLMPVRNLDVVFDKPFAFALRDAQTGLIIAAGFTTAVEGTAVLTDAPPVSANFRSAGVPNGARAEAQRRELEGSVRH